MLLLFLFIVIQTEGKLSAMDKEIKLCVQRDSTVSATTVCTCTYKFEQNNDVVSALCV